jgi:RNA polymerase sigma-70 factor, ECF subfamily
MTGPYDSTLLLALHRRLCDGDRTTPEEVARLLLSPLVQEISRRFPRMDEQIIADGVTDAILAYCAEPERFDEKRGVPLDRFLHMASRRKVANSWRGEKRRKVREERASRISGEALVELDPAAGNLLQREKTEQRQRQQVRLMNMLPNQQDQQILALRLQGERRTEVFAEILGVTHLSIGDQRREVKRAKDRIDKILRRHTGGQP